MELYKRVCQVLNLLIVPFALSFCLGLQAQTLDDADQLVIDGRRLVEQGEDIERGIELIKQGKTICQKISGENSLRYAGYLYWEAVAYLMNKEYRIGMQDAEKAWGIYCDSLGFNASDTKQVLSLYGACALSDSLNELKRSRSKNIYHLFDPVKRAIGQPSQGLFYHDGDNVAMLFPCVYDIINIDSTGRLGYGCDKNGIHILDIPQRRLLFTLPVKSRHWNYTISAIGTKDDLYAIQVDKYLCDIKGNLLDSISSGYKFIPFSEDSLHVIHDKNKYAIHKKDIAHYNRLHVILGETSVLLPPEIANLRYSDWIAGNVYEISSEDGTHYGLLHGLNMAVSPIYDYIDKIRWWNYNGEETDSPFIIATNDDETILYDSERQKTTTFNKNYSFVYFLCRHKNLYWFMASSDDNKNAIVNTNGEVYELPLLSYFEYNEEKKHYFFVDGIRQESYSTDKLDSFIELIINEATQNQITPVILEATNPQIPNSRFKLTIKCAYPKEDSPLNRHVRSWISDEIQGCFEVFDLFDDSYESFDDLSPNGMYAYYQNQLQKCGVPEDPEFSNLEQGHSEIVIRDIAQSSELITYRCEALSLGEEGRSLFVYKTFNRRNGRPLTLDQVVRPEKMDVVKRLLDEHILHETEIFAGEEDDSITSFPEAIYTDFGLLPEGLVFCYQPYDLWREYSAGYYIALLPYKELKGCLTDIAIRPLEYITSRKEKTVTTNSINPSDLPGYRFVQMRELADSLSLVGDIARALALEKQYCDEILQRRGICINVENSLNRQLKNYEMLGNDSACIKTAERLIECYLQQYHYAEGAYHSYIKTYRSLAWHQYLIGYVNEALMSIQKAQRFIANSEDFELRLINSETATYQNACGNVQEAVILARKVTEDLQKITTEGDFYDPTEQINWLTNQLPCIALSANDDSLKMRSYDAALLSKNRKLAADIAISQIILESRDPLSINLYNTLMNLKGELNNQLQKGARPEDRDRIEELKDSIADTEGTLKQLSSVYGDYTRSLTICSKDVRRYLTPQEAAIEFLSVDNQKEKVLMAAILKSDNEVPTLVSLCRESQLPSSVDSIYQYLWKPIESHIKDLTTIYFSPIGRLHTLPIEYATTPSGQSLFEQKSVFRLSSTREIVLEREHKHDKTVKSSAILYGGLDYDEGIHEKSVLLSKAYRSVFSASEATRTAIDGFDYLPGTKTEVNVIKDLLEQQRYYKKVNAFTDSIGTEGSFKQLSGQDISVLHIATHGFYIPMNSRNSFGRDIRIVAASKAAAGINDKELLRSGLMLAGANKSLNGEGKDNEEDGILTSLEVASMNLTGLDLVVLSACETAKGDVTSDGVFGLQRGFKKAGAHTLLLSLVEVEDAATQLLMTEFYRNLTEGKSKRESFLNAQKYLRQYNNRQYDKPEYWATFIMIDGIQ